MEGIPDDVVAGGEEGDKDPSGRMQRCSVERWGFVVIQ